MKQERYATYCTTYDVLYQILRTTGWLDNGRVVLSYDYDGTMYDVLTIVLLYSPYFGVTYSKLYSLLFQTIIILLQ